MPVRDSRGYSLVEVVIATAIFGLAMIVLTGFFFVASGRGLLGRQVTGGAMLAQQRLEVLQAKSYASLPGFGATETLDELGTSTAGGQFTRTTTITTPFLGSPKLTKIDVTVSWSDQGVTKSVTFSTLRVDF